MADYVKSVEATGVYGRFDLKQTFQDGINILYGKNGEGKTTFLHILSNILNADYPRFAYIIFKSIEVRLNEGTVIILNRESHGNDNTITVKINNSVIHEFSDKDTRDTQERVIQRYVSRGDVRVIEERRAVEERRFDPILSTAYFPAFRTMIEAWASVQDDREPQRPPSHRVAATRLARELFGNFVPQITYPSPLEIEQQLTTEVQRAIFTVSRNDQALLSQAFLEIFSTLSTDTTQQFENSEAIIEQIKLLYDSIGDASLQSYSVPSTERVYEKLRESLNSFRFHKGSENTAVRILDVYRRSLNTRAKVQRESFKNIKVYLDAVNEFLEGKKIEPIFQREPSPRASLAVGIKFDDSIFSGLRALSSGERQIVTLIYAATHMNRQRVVLIDEPEISLHVDWQRSLLRKMSEQLLNRQIIVCTHSPMISADYEDRMVELKLVHTKQYISPNDEESDDEIGQG